jgi:thiol-disulfide isomerase/thioredoxin
MSMYKYAYTYIHIYIYIYVYVYTRIYIFRCIPCKNIEPLFLSLGQENPSMNFVSVDVDKFDEIAAAHRYFIF